MRERTVTEVLLHFLAEPEFREEALHRELAKLTEWGLPLRKALIVVQLDKHHIVDAILEELGSTKEDARKLILDTLEELGVRLDAARQDIFALPELPTHGNASLAGTAVPAAASAIGASMYQQRQIHVRRIEPDRVSLDTKQITLVGHGFERDIAVRASHEATDLEISSTLVGPVSSDMDLYQRAAVAIDFPHAGAWTIYAENKSDATYGTYELSVVDS